MPEETLEGTYNTAIQYGLMQAMGEAQEAFSVARGKDNAAAMVAAVALRAKLNGLLIECKEITLTEVQRLDDETLDKLIALKAVEAGVALSDKQPVTMH